MKDWILKQFLQWLLSNVTAEKIAEWAATVRAYVIPKLHEGIDFLIAQLRAYAQKTNTKLDDTAVDAFEAFLKALVPTI